MKVKERAGGEGGPRVRRRRRCFVRFYPLPAIRPALPRVSPATALPRPRLTRAPSRPAGPSCALLSRLALSNRPDILYKHTVSGRP
ncbi:hypothetical protein BGLA2_300061 [Burkholderia gladioli]|nr:hypothetical protein BGLA2_300061 [Burkholderia gladioli]